MTIKRGRGGFTPQDNIISILPSVVAGIISLAFITITAVVTIKMENPTSKALLILLGILGSLYLGFYYFLFQSSVNKTRFAWVNAIISSVAFGLLIYLIPGEIDNLIFALLFISTISSSLISERAPSYLMVISVTLIFNIIRSVEIHVNGELGMRLIFSLVAVVGIETIQQLKQIARQQINRLEIINDLSKQIVSTLEPKQVFSLLNAAFQNALEADSYYLGIVDGEDLRLELFYDDDEYFDGVKFKRKGTLSNWVIENQLELFLPDLREKVILEGVETVVIGKQKAAFSWMGVPMRGTHIDGVMAISSYKPNAFDRSDMELLSNIAQRAAFALDNAYQHAQVEEQARLDSLTQVYNHGYFIRKLQKQSEECLALNQRLSVIMLDIDYFKQYNDTFGHIIGDEILVSLCKIIRTHIKSTDAVGRWGGEEFAVSLPNTNTEQALHIAERIQKSMASIKIRNEKQITIRVPTISQGIAVLPQDTKNINKLIDIADKRLYIAKERGRDQIEPAPTFVDSSI